MLNHTEWNKFVKIIEQLWLPVNDNTFKENVLKLIKEIIPFNLAGFCYYKEFADYHEAVIENYIMIGDFCSEFMDEHKYMYDNIYGKYDYTKWLLGSKESVVCRESDIVSSQFRDKSKFYTLFLEPRNLIYCMDCYIINEAIPPHILFFYRDTVSGDFSDKELYMLNRLMPHVEGRLVLEAFHSNQQNETDSFSFFLKKTYQLTPKEIEIARLIKNGNNNQEISNILSIEISTVKKHITHILEKTHETDRLKLIKLFNLHE